MATKEEGGKISCQLFIPFFATNITKFKIFYLRKLVELIHLVLLFIQKIKIMGLGSGIRDPEKTYSGSGTATLLISKIVGQYRTHILRTIVDNKIDAVLPVDFLIAKLSNTFLF
jgi:hypothetical protein